MSDLRCDQCDPVWRRYRGCGVAPVVEGERWDLVSWLESMHAQGATHDTVRVRAPGEYHLADRGGVWTTLGWLWPHCPRWYIAFGDPLAVSIAREIVDLRRLVKMGLAGNLGAELTPAGFELLAMADRLWDALQADHERKQLEEARRRNE